MPRSILACTVGIRFVSKGGLEPPRPLRALAPQASASAIPPLRRVTHGTHAGVFRSRWALGARGNTVHVGDARVRLGSTGRFRCVAVVHRTDGEGGATRRNEAAWRTCLGSP